MIFFSPGNTDSICELFAHMSLLFLYVTFQPSLGASALRVSAINILCLVIDFRFHICQDFARLDCGTSCPAGPLMLLKSVTHGFRALKTFIATVMMLSTGYEYEFLV